MREFSGRFLNFSHSNIKFQTSPDRQDKFFQNECKIEYVNPSARISALNIQVTSRPKKKMKESELLNSGFLFFLDT